MAEIGHVHLSKPIEFILNLYAYDFKTNHGGALKKEPKKKHRLGQENVNTL